MKTAVLTLVLFILSFTSINAQTGGLLFETKIQLPTNTPFTDQYSVGFGLQAGYLFKVAEGFRVGPSISGDYFLGKEDVDAAFFLPITASLDYSIIKNRSAPFGIGSDIGYALGISPEGNDGGFYFRPYIRYSIFQLSYANISLDSDNSFGALQIGFRVDAGLN